MARPVTTRAFSLIEMVLVVVIAGIAAMVAVPRLGSGYAGSRLAGLENRMVAEFALVGELARAQGRSHTIQFNIASAEMRVFEGAGASRAGLVRTVRLSDPPYESRIVSTNITAESSEITVDGFGMYSSGVKVTVSAGGVHRTVTLSGPLAGTPATAPEDGLVDGTVKLLDGVIGGLPILGGI